MPEKFAEEPFCVSENSGYRKILCIRGGRGVLRFSAENFLSHSAETFRTGTRQCFRKFLVSKTVKDKGEKGDMEGVIRFYVDEFLSHTTKKFVWEPFCVSENFGCQKILWIRGGRRYQDFPSKLFCVTVPKHFVEEPFCVSESFRYLEEFYA